jgi:UDP-galactopyranose mutase
VLLVLSHLRWDFVFQRPQHLMTRAAEAYEVVFFEEPLVEEGAEPRLELSGRPGGVTVARPILPPGLSPDVSVAAQRSLLETVLAPRAGRPLVAWFYSPMFVALGSGIAADAVIYDCMDELSAFRGAPPEMIENERRLLARADLVFTGGRSLYEAKRDRHASVIASPPRSRAKHFGQARGAQPEAESMRAIARPRLGFFAWSTSGWTSSWWRSSPASGRTGSSA